MHCCAGSPLLVACRGGQPFAGSVVGGITVLPGLAGAEVLRLYNPNFTARALYYNAPYRLGATRALHYNAAPPRCRLGPLLQCAVPPRHRSGPSLQCALPPQYRSDPLLQCAAPPRCRFGAARALYCNARHRLGTARTLHYNAGYRLGAARAHQHNGTASVPLGPSITMRGTARALLQCGVPPRHRIGTARALYCNAPFTKFMLDRSKELPRKHRPTESHETQPYHCSPRASSNGALHTCPKAFQVCFALNHELRFPRNLWPSFWCPKTVAKPVSPWMTSPVDCVFGP